MSEKFEQVKYYYKTELWSIVQMKNAVRKSWITPEEYKEITGTDYAE